MLWKDESEPSIKYSLGGQVDVVEKFITKQSFGQNWWWANGTRVEYFPRIHQIETLQEGPRVTVKIERNTTKNHRTDQLHVDVQRHLMGIWRQWKKANQVLSSFLSMQRDFHLEDCHSSDLGQKRSGILLMLTDQKENGTELPNWWWWWNSLFADTQSFDPRVHCPEECSEAKVVENYHYTSALMRETIEAVRTKNSANQLSIYRAVSDLCEVYETLHDRSGRPVVMGQSCSVRSKQKFLWRVMTRPTKILFCSKIWRWIEKLSQQVKVNLG